MYKCSYQLTCKCLLLLRRLLNAMHQAKIEDAIQQAKALKKAMETGQLATVVSCQCID